MAHSELVIRLGGSLHLEIEGSGKLCLYFPCVDGVKAFYCVVLHVLLGSNAFSVLESSLFGPSVNISVLTAVHRLIRAVCPYFAEL